MSTPETDAKTDLFLALTPEAVLQALFDAAQSEDTSVLGSLCDPHQQNDGDTDCLCALDRRYKAHQCSHNSMNKVSFEDFQQYFQLASVRGPARIEGDEAEGAASPSAQGPKDQPPPRALSHPQPIGENAAREGRLCLDPGFQSG